MASQTKPVQIDAVQIEANFSRGIVRDSARSLIPEGGVYDAVDFMLEQPGRAYKRGGWVKHSAALPAAPSMVGTIHIPTRVVAISNNDLYDVTSETGPQATLVGTVGFSPRENSPIYVGKMILCDGEIAQRPKKVHTTGPTGAVTLSPLGGNPPYAAHSTVYASRIVLARGSENTAGFNYSDAPQKNRVWFSELPDVEATWDYATKYIDTTYEITGLASIQGVLLIFSPHFCERLIGGVPPGVPTEPDGTDLSGNMELQPVGGVGCVDARSIVTLDNQIIFGSQEGIFSTNGVGFVNLMENEEHSGILSFWRSLFAESTVRSVVCGMLNRDYLFVSTHSTDGSDFNFICYLPTKTWVRTKNTTVNMFASGATEQETSEMYGAMRVTPYVGKFSPVLKPTVSNSNDGDPGGIAVEPTLETRMFGSGPGLKAFAFARMTYDMRAATSTTLAVSQAVGLEAESYQPVYESPLPVTTKAERTRFRLFKDTQALYLKLAQQGPSEQTEVFLVEVEHRSYGLPADGD